MFNEDELDEYNKDYLLLIGHKIVRMEIVKSENNKISFTK